MGPDARVAIIGGGVAGVSLLYHLAAAGWSDCVLLERRELTAGSTWHAAGLCTQFHANPHMSALLQDSVRLYGELSELTGGVGFRQCGSLRLATTPEQLAYFARVRDRVQSRGLAIDVIPRARVHELWPDLEVSDVLGGAFIATDGHIDPTDLTNAMAQAARAAGAGIRAHCEVVGLHRDGSDWHVETTQGSLTADVVVNAAGMWAPHIAAMVGHPLPVVPLEHQYLVTSPVELQRGGRPELPVLRDPVGSFYVREEGRGLLVGPFEGLPVSWSESGAPRDFGAQLLPPDLDRIERVYAAAARRVPLLADAPITTVVNGPDSYTPDGLCLLGWVPGVEGMFVLSGFSIFGIVFAGGAGRAAAEVINSGRSSIDLSALAPGRFGPLAAGSGDVVAGAKAAYAAEYAIHDEGLKTG